MTARSSYDKAAIALGVAALASLASLALSGDLRFVLLDGAAIIVTVVLGLLAILAGVASLSSLARVTGAVFVAAAVLQVVLVSLRETWLGGSTSTSALWLGLGVGLLAISWGARAASTTRHQMTENIDAGN